MSPLRRIACCLAAVLSTALLSAEDSAAPLASPPDNVQTLVSEYKRLRASAKAGGDRLKSLRPTQASAPVAPSVLAERVALIVQQRAIQRKMDEARQAIGKALGAEDDAMLRELQEQAARIDDPMQRRELLENYLAMKAVFAGEDNAMIEELLK